MTLVTMRVQDDTLTHNRISGVLVRFFQITGEFVTSGSTDVNGQTVVDLPDGSYDATFYKTGLSIVQPQRVVVNIDESNIFLVTGHVYTPPESLDPRRCKISGYVVGAGGGPNSHFKLTISIVQEFTIVDDKVVCPVDPIEVQPDSNGYVEFDLLRETTYQGSILFLDSFGGVPPGTFRVTVPNLPSWKLSAMLQAGYGRTGTPS